MCLILFAWRAHAAYPLLLAANRDEYFNRAAAPLHEWPDAPGLFAGRDLIGGGAWLGFHRNGRFAALTNYRDPARFNAQAPSRGALVADYLRSDCEPQRYLQQIDAAACNGFNLLLGDQRRLIVYNNINHQQQELQPGLYGLANGIDAAGFPKVDSGVAALGAALELKDAAAMEAAMLQLLRDERTHADHLLAASGVPIEVERRLSAAFIRGPEYGSRCSTLLCIGVDAGVVIDEITWGSAAAQQGRRRYRLTMQQTR